MCIHGPVLARVYKYFNHMFTIPIYMEIHIITGSSRQIARCPQRTNTAKTSAIPTFPTRQKKTNVKINLFLKKLPLPFHMIPMISILKKY